MEIIRNSKKKLFLSITLVVAFTLSKSINYIVSNKISIVSNIDIRNNISEKRIPSIVHFVIGQGDSKNLKLKYARSSYFSFINYLTFLAARRQLQPEIFYVHYYEQPNTFWWNQTKHDQEINTTLIKTRHVQSIFNRSVDHHAHRADIVRIEVLLKYGGIYLDSDVLVLRSFDPLLNMSDVVMANQDDNTYTACNAVILSKRNSKFLTRLYDAYQSFNQQLWDYHSIRLPGILAHIYSNEIKLLPTNTFFRPSWIETQKFFNITEYNFSSNYASHLWNKVHNTMLNKLTAHKILNENFILAQMLRQTLGNETLMKLRKYSSKYLE